MNTENSRKQDTRVRNYATIVYPDSAPENWSNILAEQIVPCFISPLHDKDLNPTGEAKKPHYHVLFMFEGKKSMEQVLELCKAIGGVGCEKVNSLRGYSRYLCHLDNPEKYQYNQSDVRSLGGADYTGATGLPVDKYRAISEMIEFCKEFDVYSYSELLEYSMVEKFDWFRVLCDNGTVVIKEYLKSRAWTNAQNIADDADDYKR